MSTNFIHLPNKPPILWVRGDEDAIISNESLSDIATYGKMGLVPGYPGVEVCPPQPMVDQIKDVMTRYGNCEEVVMVGCGHSPQMERFDEFMTIVMNFLNKLS